MTDRDTTNRSMRDVSHTHPYSDHGAVNRPFERGPVVAADGGERVGDSRTSNDERSESFGSEREHGEREERVAAGVEDEEDPEDDESNGKMRDVDHTPPRDAESANRVFERGGKEEPVESEE